MSPFHAPSQEEYDQGKKDYGLLGENEYIVEIDSYLKRDGVKNQYNPDGHHNYMVFLTPISFFDDPEAELVDKDDKELDPDKRIVFFFDHTKMGLKPQIAKSRKFLYAALGLGITDELTYPSPEDALDAAIGKKLVVYVGIKNGNNNVMDSRPIKRKAASRPAKAATPVAAAVEAFGDDIKSATEDDSEF